MTNADETRAQGEGHVLHGLRGRPQPYPYALTTPKRQAAGMPCG
jgi:hypothetical protein